MRFILARWGEGWRVPHRLANVGSSWGRASGDHVDRHHRGHGFILTPGRGRTRLQNRCSWTGSSSRAGARGTSQPRGTTPATVHPRAQGRGASSPVTPAGFFGSSSRRGEGQGGIVIGEEYRGSSSRMGEVGALQVDTMRPGGHSGSKGRKASPRGAMLDGGSR
jgi:hypothetical protein